MTSLDTKRSGWFSQSMQQNVVGYFVRVSATYSLYQEGTMAERKANPPSSGFDRLAQIERELSEKKEAASQPEKRPAKAPSDRKQ
jgi:hypothetical protein